LQTALTCCRTKVLGDFIVSSQKINNAKSHSSGSVGKLVAISYSRVSTGKQAELDRSGEERQELEIARWLRDHPDYELDRAVRDVVSGAKAGRFEWFINELEQGRLPPGTCLVVEKMSRLGREGMTDTIRTLLRIFDAGGSIACCKVFNGRVLNNLDTRDQQSIFGFATAIDAARVEWEDKSDRAKGAHAQKRRLIKSGQHPFQERTKEKPLTNYPFWLTFDKKTCCFKENNHSIWVKQVFEWAKEVGSTTICKKLKEQGIRRSVDGRSFYTAPSIVNLLRNEAVIGNRQLYDGKKPIDEVIIGVYPPIVSLEDFKEVRNAVKQRHCGNAAVASPRMHLLFENRAFCIHCGSRLGLYTSKKNCADGTIKHYSYLRCMTAHYDKEACLAPRRPYQEERILERFQSFRWDSYFNSDKNIAKLKDASILLLTKEDTRNNVKRELANVNNALREQAREGSLIQQSLEDVLQQLNKEYDEADVAVNIASINLDKLKRQKTGTDAAKVIRKRVDAFLNSDRNDINARQEFNRWLFAERLVVAYDLIEDRFELGVGTVNSKGRNRQGRLIELDQTMEDAAVLGIDPALFVQDTHQ